MKNLKFIMRKRAARAIACWLAANYIRLIRFSSTWRVEGTEIPESFINQKKPFIVAFWHGRLLMMSQAWPYKAPFKMLISNHPDGDLIAQTIRHLGFKSIFGSSSHGGASALRSILRALDKGVSVGVTPDGPKGPNMKASPGIVFAAQQAGVPILPITYAAKPSTLLSSWDRLMIPFPFSSGILKWGKPINVKKDGGEDYIEEITKILEEQLNQMTQTLDKELGLTKIIKTSEINIKEQS